MIFIIKDFAIIPKCLCSGHSMKIIQCRDENLFYRESYNLWILLIEFLI